MFLMFVIFSSIHRIMERVTFAFALKTGMALIVKPQLNLVAIFHAKMVVLVKTFQPDLPASAHLVMLVLIVAIRLMNVLQIHVKMAVHASIKSVDTSAIVRSVLPVMTVK